MAEKKKTVAEISAKQETSPPSPQEPKDDTGRRSPVVVGIGASAGGLDAFKRFFVAVPDATGVAFVLIQHLDPTHESLTAELLSKYTTMPVVQATDEMPIEPNHVYVIPPNKYLSIDGDALRLSKPIERRGIRVPIDFFFRSLATTLQQRAVGIILSGTGNDGTLGAGEIKATGGIVFAQSPDTATFDGMPQSAIAANVVDCILPVEQMPEKLNRYLEHASDEGGAARNFLPTANVPSTDLSPSSLAEALTTSPAQYVNQLNTILGLMRARMRYDFRCYKKGRAMQEIAKELNISPNTVGTHRERIKEKLGLASSPELVRKATLWVSQNP